MSFSGIALIGLRGSRQIDVGKMLEKRSWSFVRAQKCESRRIRLSVAEIIALYGQGRFFAVWRGRT